MLHIGVAQYLAVQRVLGTFARNLGGSPTEVVRALGSAMQAAVEAVNDRRPSGEPAWTGPARLVCLRAMVALERFATRSRIPLMKSTGLHSRLSGLLNK